MNSEFEDDEFTDSDIESDGGGSEDLPSRLPSRLPSTCGLCRLDVDAEDNDGILEFKESCPWANTYKTLETHTFHGECIELVRPELMRDQQIDPGVYNATILEPFAERRFLPPPPTSQSDA
ncbi:hypothetical protein BFJ72_g3083 [Fusarium proliferatum]|uniref:Uncharacterized protein n=1 Tax=Gibberella intermedia TaxID=948311 RepID=A0A420TX33_GIBIN|nr:hypothetical protein BFJ72_g3083 [Fusarium proliferatum]